MMYMTVFKLYEKDRFLLRKMASQKHAHVANEKIDCEKEIRLSKNFYSCYPRERIEYFSR